MSFNVWRHLLRARYFVWRHRNDEAATEYRAVLKLVPNSRTAINGLAFQLAAHNRYPEAEQLFRQSLRDNAKQPLIWYNLGFVCDKQGRHDDAITAFNEAIRQAPKMDQAWYGLGHAHAAAGRHVDAAAALEKAATLVPQNPLVWYSLGMAYHSLGDAEKVTYVAEYLNRFDRRLTRQLVVESGRSDLEYLVADYQPDFFGK